MKKTFLLASPLLLLGLLSAKAAGAVCPVCTVAVAGGIELSRWLGIDDSITGLWIGGLTVSLIIWTIDWFNRKNIHFAGRKIITAAAYYLLIVIPLYLMNILTFSFSKIDSFCGCGLDKMFVGIVSGSILFLAGALTYNFLKKKNGGRAHFPFEKVVMPIAPLIIFSAIFYFLTK